MKQAGARHGEAVFEAVRSPSRAGVSAIAASWCRSVLNHGLDPDAGGARERFDGTSLRALRAEHEVMLAVAGPVLDHMFRSVGRSGCAVILSDARGVILDRRAGDGDAEGFTSVGLVEGARWGEAEEGTNGIGTCLFEGKPVIIHRDQHFASRNVDISCMDAPVHDPQGRLVAALDVSSCRDDHGPAMAEMVAALVRDAARKIERDYFCRYFEGSRIVFLSDDAVTGTALLAVDRDDLVIGASRAARLRFGMDDTALAAPQALDQLLGEQSSPSFEDADRAVLRQALARAGGNASQAARLLGIGRATLYRRMGRAGLKL
ncbi:MULTISPECIES: GAF domain-containing protein [unclassified Sphingomonas]|uniref:GAF domain-containing protein n=1 Tax=unclassified Sphingomonas TaxID=196159 RepID=UPI0022B3E146|nr:GAF domain-containing protein [Sphingomonas sp. NIBR02145]WHU04639.1 helix-turn-helix domain-containing protein [Sphingomonas sp. NIBR02145]